MPQQFNDPFLYDSEQLLNITSEAVCKAGLLYFKQDRVYEHFLQQQRLFARVEVTDNELPYDVELLHDEQGRLQVFCDCTNSAEPVCKHAVATLLAYAHANHTTAGQEQQQFSSAKDSAIRDRIKRGQNEVKTEHIDGQPWFGTWQAASILSTTHRPQVYTVHIRSLSQRVNYCSCPDLSNNQLGTCKHIEAVLHQIGKIPQPSDEQKNHQLPPFVYRTVDQAQPIKIQRTGNMSRPLEQLVDQYFDPQGVFCGRLPDDFFHFCDRVYDNDQIVIGEDARLAVQQLVSEQSHQLEAHKIHRQIMLSDGQLPGINAKLYPYQVEGAAFLAANGRVLLADDMGLGKTLQSIAAAGWLIRQAGVKRVCIICPASLKHQWAREIEKFSGFSTRIIQGGAAKRQAQYRQDKTFFILNYELALRDLTVINETLMPDLLILDEAQRLKNWRTKIAGSIKLIHSRYAFVLTGTPLENRLEDLYSLMQVVDPAILGPLWRYFNDYHITDEKGKVLGYRNLSELRNRISPVMLRRNRAIVSSQLPGRTTLRLDVPMNEQQIELHDSSMNNAGIIANIAKRRPLTPSESNRLMAALQQARMACDAAGLVDKSSKGSPKLKELKALIEEQCLDNGQKMVVFSQWRGMTTMVAAMLQQMTVGFVHLHGGIATDKRGALLDSFKDDDTVSVFISTDAGGTGLNLQSATMLVNLDIPWNPAVLEQRNARIHRLGQTNKVQIVLMIAENSYEQRVWQLVNDKQELFDNVIDPNASQDSVGVSKKALAAVLDEFDQDDVLLTDDDGIGGQTDANATVTAKTPADASAQPIELPGQLPSQLSAEDQQIKQALVQIQQQFARRIERIMAKGGGLLVILSHPDPADDAFVDNLNLSVPVALIELKTLQQLQALGINTLTNDARTITLEPSTAPAMSPWIVQAREKLTAAGTLLNRQVNSGVIELICSAIAAVLGEKASEKAAEQNQPRQPMTLENLPLWLYSQAIPEQLLSTEQVNTISRITGLRLANPIPDALLVQCFDDAQRLFAELTAGGFE